MTEKQNTFVGLGKKLETVNTLLRELNVLIDEADKKHNLFVGDVSSKGMEDYSAGILSGLKKAWNILDAKKKQYIAKQDEIAQQLMDEADKVLGVR